MQDKLLTELEQKLDCLQGLAEVKSNIHAWIRLLHVCQIEKSQGLYDMAIPLHLVLIGESGTGKTETGKIIAQSYQTLELLTEGKLIIKNAALLTKDKILEEAHHEIGNAWMINHVHLMPDEILENLLEILQWENFAVIFSGTEFEIEKMLYQFPVLRLKLCKYLYFTDAQPMGFYSQNRNTEMTEKDLFDLAEFIPDSVQIPGQKFSGFASIDRKEGDFLCAGARMDLTPYVRNEIRIRFVYEALKQRMEIDAYVFMLYENEQTRQDEDLIFFGNCCSRDGSVCVVEKAVYPECGFYLSRVDAKIQKIAVCFSAYGNNPAFDFSQIQSPALRIFQGNTQIAYMDLSNLQQERTVVAVELYRYKNSWKLRAVAAGYCDGLKELCGRFGIQVE